jgi:ABC-2 type transport system permease protein
MKFYWQLKRVSFQEIASDRATFFLEASVTALSSLIFFSLWTLFFRAFKSIGGWQLGEMGYLFALLTGSYGISVFIFGGSKKIAQRILTSSLDAYLLSPKSPLLHILLAETLPRGVGDILVSCFLTLYYGFGHPADMLLLAVSIVSGALVLTAARIMASSLCFFSSSIEDVTRKYMDSLLLLASYPAHIYTGVLKVVMYTAIPAGIISTMPVELIQNFSLLKLATLLASCALFCAAANWLFYKGLRAYESGR